MPAHHSASLSFFQILSLFCSTSLGLIHHSLIHPKAQEVLLNSSQIFLSFKMNIFTEEDINMSSTRPFKVPVLVTLRNRGKRHRSNSSVVACTLYPKRSLICFLPLFTVNIISVQEKNGEIFFFWQEFQTALSSPLLNSVCPVKHPVR